MTFRRYFLLKFDADNNGEYVAKVGQDPSWEITLDKNLENELGEYSILYKNGLMCESQSYGIGAFAYYRRMVEQIIEKLLADIPQLMTDEEREKYLDALKQVKEAKNAEEKIGLVKDLLPSNLRPGGMNPLRILHGALSTGIHTDTDEECTQRAQQIRTALVYLVNRILTVNTADAEYTDAMKKILERKTER